MSMRYLAKTKPKLDKKRAERFVWSEGDIEFGKPLSKEELDALKKPKPKPDNKPEKK